MNISLATPRDWWEKLNSEFEFTLDAAASDEFHMVDNYYTEEDNALALHWRGIVWCSPPWGESQLPTWIRHGYEEAKHGSTVVMLLPMRQKDNWWEDYALGSSEIRVIQGELDFVPMSPVPPGVILNVEPHCLVVFRRGEHTPKMSSYPAK